MISSMDAPSPSDRKSQRDPDPRILKVRDLRGSSIELQPSRSDRTIGYGKERSSRDWLSNGRPAGETGGRMPVPPRVGAQGRSNAHQSGNNRNRDGASCNLRETRDANPRRDNREPMPC